MKFSIVTAKEKDMQEILKLIKKHGRYDAITAERYYKKYFYSDDSELRNDQVFVGKLDGKIIGVIGYSRDYYGTERSYWLGWFYVHPKYRGKGYGQKLLKAVEAELRRYNVKRLFADTTSNEIYKWAVKFYLSNGFRLEGTLRDYYGKGEDQIIFGKDL